MSIEKFKVKKKIAKKNPICQLWEFEWGTESKKERKWGKTEKNINAAATGNRTELTLLF